MASLPFNKHTLRFSCQHCTIRQLCFPVGLSLQELSSLNALISQQIVIRKGEYLFKEHAAFKGFYVVRSGAFKYYQAIPGGEDHIIAFYMPGDFFGLDAIHTEHHPASAIALEDSSACVIAFDELMQLTRHIPTLQRYFMDIVSQHCAQMSHRHPLQQTAEQKLALFLLDFSAQFARRGCSAHEFQLPMARKDIGNYLGLAHETVSRLFKTLQDKGIITASGKLITLRDRAALQEISEAKVT